MLLCTAIHAASHNARAKKVIAIIDKVNTYWQANNKAEVRAFWDNAAYHTGNMEAWFLTGEPRYLNYSLQWAEHNNWMGATEPDPAKWEYKTYGEDQRHVLFGDWQICFQTYIDLYWVAMGKYAPQAGNVQRPPVTGGKSQGGDGLRGRLQGQRLLVVGRRPLYGDARDDQDVQTHR